VGTDTCKCKIYLRGCDAGYGPNGKALLQAVANTTGCTTYGWTTGTTLLTPWEDLPGDGIPILGWFGGPEAKAIPQQ